jgi:hypothetical protein
MPQNLPSKPSITAALNFLKAMQMEKDTVSSFCDLVDISGSSTEWNMFLLNE